MPIETAAATAFELGLVAVGWFLLWRLCFAQAAREQKPPPLLRPWNVSLSNFAAAVGCVAGGWLVASTALGWVLRHFPSFQSDDTLMLIVGGSITQVGVLFGAVTAWFYLQATSPTTSNPNVEIAAGPEPKMIRYRLWSSALATVIITISIVHPVQWLWEQLLKICDLPTEKQDVVSLFFRAQSPGRIIALAIIAVVVAPIMEEFVFRAGLFRYARGRLPRYLALSLPALLFASLHVNWATFTGLVTLAPLAVFGIVFSLAYERTGRIAVVMLAHALFNLHTLVFLLLGLTD